MNTTETTVKMIFDRWNASVTNLNTLLSGLDDAALLKEIAPGKNRGVYLLGHLIAVHDDMLILLDMGEKLYPELYEPFLTSPDNKMQVHSIAELRSQLANQNEVMKQKFDSLKPDDWFEKHTAVSESDFANEPHRNKLNIILTRTTHLQYHIGQLRLLK